MLTKALDDLTPSDFADLAQTGISESRYLDFKAAAVGGADDDRREFLADVSAFANAAGGDLVCGIVEKDGVAVSAPGIALADPDKEILRLDDLIRSGLQPRILDVRIKWVQAAAAGVGFIVVRVPRSWTAPHRVTLRSHDKFYIRNSAGKHPMNVDELRRAFTLGQELADRIRGFRTQRVATILEGETPVDMYRDPKIIIHIVPLISFTDAPELAVGASDALDLVPIGASGGWHPLHTFEGFVTYVGNEGELSRSYVLMFRNGIIETAALLPKTDGVVSLTRIEASIFETWRRYLKVLNKHSLEPPYYFFLTLTDVRNSTVKAPFFSSDKPVELRRDILYFPEVQISQERVGLPNTELLRPICDRVANAFGLARSFNYKVDGSYQAQDV